MSDEMKPTAEVYQQATDAFDALYEHGGLRAIDVATDAGFAAGVAAERARIVQAVRTYAGTDEQVYSEAMRFIASMIERGLV